MRNGDDQAIENFVRKYYPKAANYLYVIADNLCRDYHKRPDEISMEELTEQPVYQMETMDLRLDIVIAMMPVSLLEFYQHPGTFDLITIFGKVFRVLDVCLPLYAVLTMVLVPVIYRQFRRKQIA